MQKCNIPTTKMYYISQFCCACLKNDKTLVDLKNKQIEPDTLINKLKICVSEVAWSDIEIMMCESCIQKLNTAFDFKQQCLKSAQTLQQYILELKSDQSDETAADVSISVSRKEVKQEIVDEYVENTKDLVDQKPLLRVKPCNELFDAPPTDSPKVSGNPPIAVTPKATPFPNIFLNFVPAYPCNNNTPLLLNSLDAHRMGQFPPRLPPPPTHDQNMFYPVNGMHKMFPFARRPLFIQPPQVPRQPQPPIRIPVPPINTKVLDDINISQILTTTNSEEVSVEIDPICFDDESESEMPHFPTEPNDWEALIDTNKIDMKLATKYIPNVPIPPLIKLTELNTRLKPQIAAADIEDRLMDFLNVDHFMAVKVDKPKPVACEQCGQLCDSLKSLHFHTKQIHKGKYPYSCKECLTVFVLNTEYRAHIKKHNNLSGGNMFFKDIITLDDLSTTNEAILFPPLPTVKPEEIVNELPSENVITEYKCMECSKIFTDLHVFSRHKLRDHSAKKKYFIKGMKNAKCDICNREFSTHSYLQQHIKLHDRKNSSKLKVLNKTKYKSSDKSEEDIDCDEKVKAQEEPIIERVCEVEQPKSPKGIKITINLKNIKEAIQNKEDDEDEELNQNGCSDSDTFMEVDNNEPQEPDRLVNGSCPLSIEMPLQENGTSVKDSLVCDELPEQNGELPKETDLPEPQDSPIATKFKIVDGKPQCSFCFKLFSRKHDLKRHINNIHLKAIQYVCHLCNTQFYEAFHLTRHLRQHNSFVRCGICLREFSVLRDLRVHISSSHDEATPIQCGTCGEMFSRIKYLEKHMYIHDRDIFYKCHICNVELKESRELSRHLVEHSGMYSCNVCHSTYSTDYELCNHMKNHSVDGLNERKYECEICRNRYKKKRYLVNHMNNCHSSLKLNDFNVMRLQINESI